MSDRPKICHGCPEYNAYYEGFSFWCGRYPQDCAIAKARWALAQKRKAKGQEKQDEQCKSF